ncbi:MAG TPA: carboxypeptidase-like regulatory domain-containing protein [Terracidiphilus sp.]
MRIDAQERVSFIAKDELPEAPQAKRVLENPGQVKSELPGMAAPNEKGTANISGTVLDTNSSVIQGARVVLSSRAATEEREVVSGANGQFEFSGLQPGSYKVTVTGPGMGTFVTPWLAMHAGEIRIVSDAVLPIAPNTTNVMVSGDKVELAEEQVEIAVEQRVWGVFPNFYSSYDWNAPPMGAKQKFKLAFRSMMDPMAFAGAAGIAGFEQYENIFPGYGGGIGGYAKRYGAAYTNDFSARMLASGLFASLFRQDPRYFYKGTGSTSSRALYAMSAAVIARNDNGHWRPNYSHVLGTFAAGALSNLYYPAASRGLSLTLVNGLVETAGNAGTNIVREFVLKGITKHAGGKP